MSIPVHSDLDFGEAATAKNLAEPDDPNDAVRKVDIDFVHQHTPQVYTGGVQTLTTTPEEVDGSSYTVTPVFSSSRIIYETDLQVARVDVDGIVHFSCLVDGVEQTAWRKSHRVSNGDHLVPISFSYENSSTTPKVFKLEADNYSTGLEVKLHETYLWNGSASSQSSGHVVRVTEYKL